MRGSVFVLFAIAGICVAEPENLPEGTSQIGSVHTPRIVGGDTAEPGQFPYIVDMKMYHVNGQFISCAASILTEDFLLTAAHCCKVGGVDVIKITAGEHNVREDDGTEQLRSASRIIPHEEYNSNLFSNENDICLLQLDAPLIFNEHVSAIPLPSRFDEPSTDTPYLIMGWGTLQYGTHQMPDELQWAIVNYVDLKTCRENYASSPYPVTDDMICAGRTDERIDTCQGDSGGPLVDSETGTLVGIVSWGNKCAEPGFPGVYTNVAHFIDWILEKISAAASV